MGLGPSNGVNEWEAGRTPINVHVHTWTKLAFVKLHSSEWRTGLLFLGSVRDRHTAQGGQSSKPFNRQVYMPHHFCLSTGPCVVQLRMWSRLWSRHLCALLWGTEQVNKSFMSCQLGNTLNGSEENTLSLLPLLHIWSFGELSAMRAFT